MRSLYESQAGGLPLSTERLEEHLVARSGDVRGHAFHRFVYGLPAPIPAPALWLRDDMRGVGVPPQANKIGQRRRGLRIRISGRRIQPRLKLEPSARDIRRAVVPGDKGWPKRRMSRDRECARRRPRRRRRRER
ncbi:hypothetical protein ACFU6M_32305 [Streptomyces bottropensis]|uniref:hypothetical protein n=1 Tax=Streptomyces bottropensis TaxID=42235 RepID=UPI00367CDFEA